MADDMEVPRLIDESLDRTLRICRAIAREDEAVALVFAQLSDRRARSGLAALLNRRVVATTVLDRFLARGPSALTVASAAADAGAALLAVFRGMSGGVERFLETGPPEPAFLLLARQLQRLERDVERSNVDPAAIHAAFAASREYFLTQDGKPRSRLTLPRARFASAAIWEAHRDFVVGHAGEILRAWQGFRRDLNILVSRGVRRMFAIAEAQYRRTLDAHAVLDFHDVLLKALQLLRQMEEFAQSRYRLESRYHHVLVDEFQDTSRAQWELVELLIASWGEGAGLAHTGPLQPSVFIVGDRNSPSTPFATRTSRCSARPAAIWSRCGPGDVRRSISRSFRSVPALLAFVNDLGQTLDTAPLRADAFRYEEADRFPVRRGRLSPTSRSAWSPVTRRRHARSVSPMKSRDWSPLARPSEIGTPESGARFGQGTSPSCFAHVRAIASSSRRSRNAESLRMSTKGLGFFDADEIKDVLALLRYLADPTSDLRAAAILRSGFGGVSDEGLRRLSPGLAGALHSRERSDARSTLDDADRAALDITGRSVRRWCDLVDRHAAGRASRSRSGGVRVCHPVTRCTPVATLVKTSRRFAPSFGGSRTAAIRPWPGSLTISIVLPLGTSRTPSSTPSTRSA